MQENDITKEEKSFKEPGETIHDSSDLFDLIEGLFSISYESPYTKKRDAVVYLLLTLVLILFVLILYVIYWLTC